jgi:hypothetical protein
MSTNRADLYRLLVAIKESGTGIRDAITAAAKTTLEAIGQNTEASRESGKQTSTRPLERVTVDLKIPSEETDRYYSEQNKANKLQLWTLWATVLTFLAVVAYAEITFLQWRTMNRTYIEISKQTKATVDATDLLRKQLTGTQAAIVDFSILFDSDHRQMQIGATNSGHWTAFNVSAGFTATALDMPGRKTVGTPLLATMPAQTLAPAIQDASGNGSITTVTKKYDAPEFDLGAMKRLAQVIKIEWSGNYNNGFVNISRSGCSYQFFANFVVVPSGEIGANLPLVDCGEFDSEFKKAMASRLQAEAQVERGKKK